MKLNEESVTKSAQWGAGKFFESEEEWRQYQEDERKNTSVEPASSLIGPSKSVVSKNELSLTTLNDLLAEPEEVVDWIVEGLLPKGGLSVIAAKPKVGKSTLTRQLALCVARGDDFLGRITSLGLVVYLAFEERRSDVRGHFKLMGADGTEQIKIFAGMAPENAIKHVRYMVEKEKPVLIIVDTLQRLTRIKDLNDYSQATLGIEPLLIISRETGSHVCFVHHAKKGDSKGIDSVLGSTGITATVDTVITLRRTENYRSVSSTQRVGDEIEETVLTFDGSRRWTELGGTKQQVEIERAKDAILEFLNDKSIDEQTIGESVEIAKKSRVRALRELVEEGKVERSGAGKRGDPYLYKKSGSLVHSISLEPENQKPNNAAKARNHFTNPGSQELLKLDSGSESKKALQAVLQVFPEAKVVS